MKVQSISVLINPKPVKLIVSQGNILNHVKWKLIRGVPLLEADYIRI